VGFVAGRRAHQGERTRRALGEALQQPRADQEAGSGAGDMDRSATANSPRSGPSDGRFPWPLIVVAAAWPPGPRRQDPPHLPLSSDATPWTPTEPAGKSPGRGVPGHRRLGCT
jgi:hypothetical protein